MTVVGSRRRRSGRESLRAGACLLALLVAGGCAHGTLEEPTSPNQAQEARGEDAPEVASVTSKGELVFRDIKLKNSQFDFPVTLNSRVEYWIDYFTGRGRPHFERYLERSELFVPYIRPILKQNGLPQDLVYLAMIESGFNNHARSRAKAVGPWQFISATGKRYGLMVNWWVDERRDTRKSTLAAVEYLRDLYGIFRSWELAAAAYNAGESKVARAVRRFGTKDFWVIARHRFLRPETRDYVPKIIAAAIIAKNREQFGFGAETIHPGAGEVISPDGEVVRVVPDSGLQTESAPKQGAAPESTLAGILRAEDYDPYEDAPESEHPAMLAASAELRAVEPDTQPTLAKSVQTPHVGRKGELVGEALSEFEVESPADLLKVARAAGLSYQTVKQLNPELLRWCTPPTVGDYRVKLPTSIRDRFLATYNHISYPRKVQFLSYKVRQGETLSRIARHFGIRVDPISDLNGVSARLPLRTGLRVLLPMPNDRSRSIASLEIRDPPDRGRVRRLKYRHKAPKYYKVSYKRREAARKPPPLARPDS